MPQGPPAGRDAAVAAMVMFALIPYPVLFAALDPLTPLLAKQLHTSLQTMSLSSGLGTAAYAAATVLHHPALRTPAGQVDPDPGIAKPQFITSTGDVVYCLRAR